MEDTQPKFQKNLGHFLHFYNFWAKTQVFLHNAPRHLVLAFDGGLLLMKTHNFWIFREKICMLTNDQEILTGFEPPKM